MADPGWGIWVVQEPVIAIYILLIKMLNFISLVYKTHENMHILLAFITNSPETKVKLAVQLSFNTFIHTKCL